MSKKRGNNYTLHTKIKVHERLHEGILMKNIHPGHVTPAQMQYRVWLVVAPNWISIIKKVVLIQSLPTRAAFSLCSCCYRGMHIVMANWLCTLARSDGVLAMIKPVHDANTTTKNSLRHEKQ